MSSKWLRQFGDGNSLKGDHLRRHCELDSIFFEKLLEICQIVEELLFLKQEVSDYFFVYSSFHLILLSYINVPKPDLCLQPCTVVSIYINMRKNTQVVTGLQTSCYKSVHKLCSHCLFPSCCNKFGTSC